MTQPTHDDGIVRAREVVAAARASGVITAADHATADEALCRMGELSDKLAALGAEVEVKVTVEVSTK